MMGAIGRLDRQKAARKGNLMGGVTPLPNAVPLRL